MPRCKRTTEDPLLRAFLDTYGLNLLSVPREDVDPGTLYVHTGDRVSSSGSLTHFLAGAIELPETKRDEAMAGVMGKVTNAVTLSTGLSLLQGFFAALGAAALFGDVGGNYKRAKAHSLRFSMHEATRDSLDVGLLGSLMGRQRFDERHALVNPGNRYYVVAGVARSPSISVTASTKAETTVALDTDVMAVAAVDADVAIVHEGEGTYTYRGSKPLAFGVELYELRYNEKRRKLQMVVPETAIGVRRGRDPGATRVLVPAAIDTEGDDAFFELD